MINIEILVEEDCIVLLERALLDKTICAFGEDGFGRYGRNDRASWFTVKKIDVSICMNDEDVMGAVAIYLTDYNSAVSGHIMTDKNFEIRLKALLKDAFISPDALVWQDDDSQQGDCVVVMDINISELLDWA